jgi:PAS domain-containing protein
LRYDGQPFLIRVSLSQTGQREGEDLLFSALIEPVYECTIRTDDKGMIVSADGSPFLFFGFSKEELVGQLVYKLLQNPNDWQAKAASGPAPPKVFAPAAVHASSAPATVGTSSPLVTKSSSPTGSTGFPMSPVLQPAPTTPSTMCNSSSSIGSSSSSSGRVVICKNSEGDEFPASLKLYKDGGFISGCFSEAPVLVMKIVLLETGVITDAVGDTKAFIGYKPKSLKGMYLTELLDEEEIAGISLDAKTVISLKHKDGRTLWGLLRVTKVKQLDGTVMYEGVVKSAPSNEVKNCIKGNKLRYGGQVFGWYELGPTIGDGMCGPVKRAVHRLTGEEVAIKMLTRQKYRELNMIFPPQEIRLLERVRHPNLIRLLDTIWTEDEIFMVMELLNGGEMFEYCASIGALPEQHARNFWRQLVGGVDYLHRSFICHRDIKLENMVLDANHNVKLVDFGFACSFYEGELMKVFW